MDDIAARAVAAGIEREYFDAYGVLRAVQPEVLERLIAALGSPQMADRPAFVWRRGRTDVLAVGDDVSTWSIRAGQNEACNGKVHGGGMRIPDGLPLGAYRLLLHSSGGGTRECTLIVAPEAAYQLDDVPQDRTWVLAVQLYAVRSRRNWGHGDFSDLRDLIRLASERGAGGVGLNPLHALFDDKPDNASPYSPNSRLFLNSLYIDLAALPEFPGVEDIGLGEEIERLRAADMVDYAGVAAAKGAALRAAYRRFRDAPDPARQADFEAFRAEQGHALARFAAFECMRRKFQRAWWEWPAPWRTPDDGAIARLRTDDPDAFGYCEFVQWVADRQLAACRDEAQRLGLPIGLYADLAVGVEPGGADAWSEQASIVPQVEIGAPPDLLNTAGQAWGLAAFSPRALEAQTFLPFWRLLEATMRYAGAIRLDHVLGLNRLFLIPFGYTPKDGAYVRYPLDALLALVATQSRRLRCLVIGEDLGTVPDALRAALADWGVWSYLVMLFERHSDGSFKMPEEYRRNALVTFNTHDLPTFTGWRSSHDLKVKLGLGLDPGETEHERHAAYGVLGALLQRFDLNQSGALEFGEIIRFLARTPSRMMIVAIEDVLDVVDQPNVPGTILEHPNWRRRLPVDLEDLAAHEGLRRIADALREEGRSIGSAATE